MNVLVLGPGALCLPSPATNREQGQSRQIENTPDPVPRNLKTSSFRG